MTSDQNPLCPADLQVQLTLRAQIPGYYDVYQVLLRKHTDARTSIYCVYLKASGLVSRGGAKTDVSQSEMHQWEGEREVNGRMGGRGREEWTLLRYCSVIGGRWAVC